MEIKISADHAREDVRDYYANSDTIRISDEETLADIIFAYSADGLTGVNVAFKKDVVEDYIKALRNEDFFAYHVWSSYSDECGWEEVCINWEDRQFFG